MGIQKKLKDAEDLIVDGDKEDIGDLKDMVKDLLGIDIEEIGTRIGMVEKKIDIIIEHQKKLTDTLINYIQKVNEMIEVIKKNSK